LPEVTLGTGDDGLNLTMSSTLRKKAKAHGLQEYSDAALIPYFRPQFTDAGIRTRLNRNIDEVGAYEKFIRIMGVGDDNTVGWGVYSTTRDKPNNYRTPLKNLLEAANYEVEFVGSQDGGHEGIKGQGIKYYADNIVELAKDNAPNLILWLGGSTTIYKELSPVNAFDTLYKANTSSVVYNLIKSSPTVPAILNNDTRLLISTIPPVILNQTTTENFDIFNNKITGTNWSTISEFITSIDPTESYLIIDEDEEEPKDKYPNTEQSKLLNQTGYNVFAEYFFNAIVNMYK